MSEGDTRFVDNRTGGNVFLQGHGVIAPGAKQVEVSSSDDLDAAIEAKVLAASTAPDTPEPEAPKGSRRARSSTQEEAS